MSREQAVSSEDEDVSNERKFLRGVRKASLLFGEADSKEANYRKMFTREEPVLLRPITTSLATVVTAHNTHEISRASPREGRNPAAAACARSTRSTDLPAARPETTRPPNTVERHKSVGPTRERG